MNQPSILKSLKKFWRSFPQDTDEPIRSELFSVERLEQHAETLAAAQHITKNPSGGRQLTTRLRENGHELLSAYRSIAETIREERAITPAAEWLVDNFHVIEDQIREIRDDLPRGFYKQLPKLADGPLEGYPRVFGITWAYVAHTDSRFDVQMLARFLHAYQRVQPLTIGELWAVAISLRVLLVENMRRVAERIVVSRTERQEADEVADRLFGVGGRPPESVAKALKDFEHTPLPRAFAVQLVQRLRDQDPAVTPALPWLDKRLAAQGTTADEIVREEHQRQAAMSVTVRNAITSMRLISAVDWTEFFESVSLVDALLRTHGIFAEMDFPTRDRYRHAIEELARGSNQSELDVAGMVIQIAKDASAETADKVAAQRQHEPGYYLISKGRPAFEKRLGYRFPLKGWVERAAASAGMQGYLATIAFFVAFFLTFPLLGLAEYGVTWSALLILALLAVIPLSDVVVALVNRWVTSRFIPKALPGLELRDGVPSNLRTMVAIPTLLTTPEEIDEQIERLEVHYLASQDGDIRFALLSDWTDAATETTSEDNELFRIAADGIARLNQRHSPGEDGPRFFLLHRRRLWNTSEEKWMGWERKRGKLQELNQLLRGATDTTFQNPTGRPPIVPSAVRYVITLDADTRLPRGAARRLVGKMAHPLNRPSQNPKTARVVEGYAVLQPRVTPALPGDRTGSFFQRLFSGPSGMDPYAFAVSDVYQDLFGEGSYTGKGIYDVDAFTSSLEGRISENTILSHDLLEGIFAGAGLASDVEVVEEFPTRYDVAATRQHRWARGDWQLLPWILGRHSAVPLIGRWKMLDNLRRSLSAPAAFLALLGGWTLPFASAVAWSGFIFTTILLPALLPVFDGFLPRRLRISKRSHFRAVVADFSLALSQVGFLVTMLAHQAWLMGDAIVRTLFRLLMSRRKLLEWVTAAKTQTSNRLDLRQFYRRLSGGVILAIIAAVLIALTGHGYRLVALPFVILWMFSPVVAWWASLPPLLVGPKPLSVEDVQALRLIGRRTWRFFETFVSSPNHMLPSDNFQETPKPVVATRTSPTNIGLYLLSIIAARDFGWMGTIEAVEKLETTLNTMSKLELFRGHLYNWYDTHDLRPLDPKYVSSVDSGNLAGHLIALGNACRQIIERPFMVKEWRFGIADALHITRESFLSMKDDRRTQTVTRTQLERAIDSLATSLDVITETPAGIAQGLSLLALQADTLTDIAGTLVEERGDGINVPANPELLRWSSDVRVTVKGHERDFELLMPWARIVSEVKAQINLPDDALEVLNTVPSLGELSDRCEALIVKLSRPRTGTSMETIPGLIESLESSAEMARSLEQRLLAIADRAKKMFNEMDFTFLFDTGRQLLSIGYRGSDGTLDPNCYDLLASEARLASFIAIAKGDVPVRHWFRLGRALTPVDRGSALISWSGSMFEYLMPMLVMRAPADSLLEQTCRLVVRRQISYGEELKIPWGISESGYNVRDIEFTYQYSNFGIPGLGLKRGLSGDAVVAPYATALAAMVEPEEAVRNFARLAEAGALGRYGFYEALDYTPSRLPEEEPVAVVRAYMAHHHGMTLVAIANALKDGVMQSRFHVEPIIQATDLLLQERTPRDVAVARPRAEEVKNAANVRELVPPILRRFRSPHQAVPRTHLLSNGKYAVMITAAGSGYSRWRDLAITRWREDVTCDPWGTYIFLRDVPTGDVWSAAYQPSGVEPDSYEVMFSEDRAEFVRHDNSIMTTLEIAVSPEDDGEVRRVSITNQGRRAREIELTSYAELVLAPPAADAAHPAFSKLFVQTEFVADANALVATRRRRSPGEPEVWAAHLAVVEGEVIGEVQFETDRARFLGRGREVRTPISVIDGRPLSNTVGPVLDPVFSLRWRLRIPAGATAHIAFWTLVAGSRSEILDQVDKHHESTAFERVLTLAWTQAQVQLHHLGVGPDEAHLFQRLANHVLYSDPSLRPSSDVLKQSELGPSTLWAHGISGDLPIILVRIDEAEDLEIVRQLLRAHEYWRMKRLAVDLVILNERPPSYSLDLQTALETVLRTNESQLPPQAEGEAARGNVFVLRTDLVSIEVRSLLKSVARAVLLSRRGSLSEQVQRLEEPELGLVTRRTPFPFLTREELKRRIAPEREEATQAPPGLEFFNGLGGFAADGREYVVLLGEGQWTPAPWINVIANPLFGFQVSVEGSGYTWSMNSRQNQITPWSNDPVTDRVGEAIYIRDEDNHEVWNPTVLPIREPGGQYVARHGLGYSRFEHASHGIALDLLQYVPTGDPIKISRLKIHNQSGRLRRLSVTTYVEWVLGPSRAASAPFIVTEMDSETGAMFARNSWRAESGQRIAFADLAGKQTTWTGDRTEFIGRNRTLDRPAALTGDAELSNKVGAGMDPCGVLQTPVELKPNERMEIVFFLGEVATKAEARILISRYRTSDLDEVFRAVTKSWDEVLDVVKVKTPDRSFDILVNHWALYQTLACRVWARSAFYQSSGAYGFRDQIQDTMALALVKPELTRAHLLRAASRQFVEGDFQHWWSPPLGQGVRTQISDDKVWLPYAVVNYLKVTNDTPVLDEKVLYLEGPLLRPGEHDAFFQPVVSEEYATLYKHCALALDRSLALGAHGLPLIGTGDWNDGMNRVGEGGKGESVWLAWFLYTTLSAFAPIAKSRGDNARATAWEKHASALQKSLEREAWDGQWYRRAYYDDGTPLGSSTSDECWIDSIAQSWAVISGAAKIERQTKAMESVEELLVRREEKIIQLFTPPFDETQLDPGYIKGYPPGIRENGGQYTHAAIWSVIAFAMLGDGDKATEMYSMLNPINHSNTRAAIRRYKVEPYVVAADVYSQPPHVGRGGWTWYTGSAGWMYRAGLEWILGFRLRGTSLILDPCIPKTWAGFEIVFRYKSARYEIAVVNPGNVNRGVSRVELDGTVLESTHIPLTDDGATHRVRVTLGDSK